MPPRLPLRLIVLALALASAAGAGRAAEFAVSPAGTAAGDGSAARPWDLQTALDQPKAVRPGDTLRLLGGVYRGVFTARLKGAAGAPVTLRAAPGARATIDCMAPDGRMGLFTVEGEHARYWGFEVTCSGTDRWAEEKGSQPTESARGGVNGTGGHIAFINLVVHDGSNGFGFWSGGEGGEIYGCIIYNNGWDAPDRGHGHAIYAQNKTGTKRLVDNVMFNQFCYGIHVYGSGRAFLNGFHVEGNASFNNGAAKAADRLAPAILVGGGSPSQGIVVRDNFTYATGYAATALQLGYGADNKDAVVAGNYFVGPSMLRRWERIEATGNTFIDPAGGPVGIEPPGPDPAALAASNTLVRQRPTGLKVFVRPNRYEPGRAHVIVYNWDRRPEVEVDLAAALKAGVRYRVVSAQDFFGKPVCEGVFDGKPVRLPMTEYRARPPIGKPDYVPPATGPEFNVFVVLPVE